MRTSFSVSTSIRVPPQRAFWFLADPSTASIIDPGVISYEPEGGSMGLGIRNHIRARMFGVPMKLVSETVVWQPGEEMMIRSIEPARPAVGVATHRFDAIPDGTRYTWSMEFVPTGFGGRLTAAVFARLFERNARVQQERVRIVLEAASWSGGAKSVPEGLRQPDGTSTSQRMPGARARR